MIILGINGGVRAGYQDVSVVLLRNGKIIAAVEEERLSRIKHSPGQLPFLSVHEVLSIGNISIREVDIIATHGSTWGDQYDEVLSSYFTNTFGFCPRTVRYHHHQCHAASAYYASGFEDAMVLTIDASGDGISLQKAIGKNGTINIVEQISRDNSIGIFYAMMTQFCGFHRDTDEYKLMGLAPYGNANEIDLSFLIERSNGDFKTNSDYKVNYAVGQPQGSRQQVVFNHNLVDKLGSPRIPNSEVTQFYKNVAASTQQLLEDVLCDGVKKFSAETGIKKLCLAGGVALNCAANQKLLQLDCVEEIYVQPAAGDAGISLGAAYLACAEYDKIPEAMTTAKLGGAFSDDEIEAQLKLLGIRYEKIEEPYALAADLILQDKIIGWVEGRAEFGPRALGSRSILASAFNKNMKEIINQKIKFREGFRPFCPSVLEEDFSKAFSSKQKTLPYMTVNVDVVSDDYPSITHVNKTARVQTVSKNETGNFPKLLQAIQQKKGTGIVVNTSFNRNKEPMVYNTIDAVSAFYGSGMDALLVGNFLVKK